MTAVPDPPTPGAQPHSHLLLNRVVTAVLRSPLHPLLSRHLLLLTYRGRTTGRAYTLPVSCQRDGDQVTVFSNQRWWRNLRGGAPVELRLRGERVPGHAEVSEDTPTVTAAIRDYLNRRGPRAGRTINLRLPQGGEPGDQALAAAAREHVVVRIALGVAEPHGALIHWARGYDTLVRIAFAGREARVRAARPGRRRRRPDHRGRPRRATPGHDQRPLAGIRGRPQASPRPLRVARRLSR